MSCKYPKPQIPKSFPIDNEDDFYLQLFEGMFPRDVMDTMVDGVNKQITGDPITYHELLHWIGLWVMMSTVAGSDCTSFWSTCDLDIFYGCFFHFVELYDMNTV